MKLWTKSTVIALTTSLLVLAPVNSAQTKMEQPASLAAKIRRFSPTVLTADTSRLSATNRKALQKIIDAARLLDPLFLRQVWSGNEALKAKLEADKSVVG